MPKDKKFRFFDKRRYEHSGAIPRTKREAEKLAKEIRSFKAPKLLVKVVKSAVQKGKYVIYVRIKGK